MGGPRSKQRHPKYSAESVADECYSTQGLKRLMSLWEPMHSKCQLVQTTLAGHVQRGTQPSQRDLATLSRSLSSVTEEGEKVLGSLYRQLIAIGHESGHSVESMPTAADGSRERTLAELLSRVLCCRGDLERFRCYLLSPEASVPHLKAALEFYERAAELGCPMAQNQVCIAANVLISSAGEPERMATLLLKAVCAASRASSLPEYADNVGKMRVRAVEFATVISKATYSPTVTLIARALHASSLIGLAAEVEMAEELVPGVGEALRAFLTSSTDFSLVNDLVDVILCACGGTVQVTALPTPLVRRMAFWRVSRALLMTFFSHLLDAIKSDGETLTGPVEALLRLSDALRHSVGLILPPDSLLRGEGDSMVQTAAARRVAEEAPAELVPVRGPGKKLLRDRLPSSLGALSALTTALAEGERFPDVRGALAVVKTSIQRFVAQVAPLPLATPEGNDRAQKIVQGVDGLALSTDGRVRSFSPCEIPHRLGSARLTVGEEEAAVAIRLLHGVIVTQRLSVLGLVISGGRPGRTEAFLCGALSIEGNFGSLYDRLCPTLPATPLQLPVFSPPPLPLPEQVSWDTFNPVPISFPSASAGLKLG